MPKDWGWKVWVGVLRLPRLADERKLEVEILPASLSDALRMTIIGVSTAL
jgi:hypothetical protein